MIKKYILESILVQVKLQVTGGWNLTIHALPHRLMLLHLLHLWLWLLLLLLKQFLVVAAELIGLLINGISVLLGGVGLQLVLNLFLQVNLIEVILLM